MAVLKTNGASTGAVGGTGTDLVVDGVGLAGPGGIMAWAGALPAVEKARMKRQVGVGDYIGGLVWVAEELAVRRNRVAAWAGVL